MMWSRELIRIAEKARNGIWYQKIIEFFLFLVLKLHARYMTFQAVTFTLESDGDPRNVCAFQEDL